MANKKTILCVDDEVDIVDCLHDVFLDIYNVKTATSGQEALEIFDKEDVVLVISDQRMPGMEGVELLARIREKNPLCKKILLAGYVDTSTTIDSINTSSVDRYFNKPWNEEELLDAVSHLVKMYDFDRLKSRESADRKRGVDALGVRDGEAEAFVVFLAGLKKGVCVVGGNSEILHVNPKGLAVLGVQEAAQVIGKNYRKVFLVQPEEEGVLFGKTGVGETEPLSLSVQRGDGATVQVIATLCFAQDQGDGFQVCGLIFEPIA